MNKKAVLISLNGVHSGGGVERVAYYLRDILEQDILNQGILNQDFLIKETDLELIRKKCSFGKADLLIWPLITSLRLFFMKRKFVITQAWQSWLYPSDFVICHGTTKGYLRKNPGEKSMGSLLIQWMEAYAFRHGRQIWAVSGNCKEELVRLYGADRNKIQVIHNFVDETVFYPVIDRQERKMLTFLYAGRLTEGKGADRLLRLAGHIETLDDCRLLIACNDSAGMDEFNRLKHTRVFRGLTVSQMNRFYNSGDILYYPTRYEGFSMATLEALSCGIPVIGSEYAIAKELVKYPYTRRVCFTGGHEDVRDIVREAKKLKAAYGRRKMEIHQEIAQAYGKEQYQQKISSQIQKLFLAERTVRKA